MNLKTLMDTPPWQWPKDAGGIILGVLRDRAAGGGDRILAAELAGNFVVASDEMVDALLSVVGNGGEAPSLRARAAISLGPALEDADTYGPEDADSAAISLGSFRRIQAALHGLYAATSVPKDVRRRILEASVRAPQDWHADAIRAAYRSGDEEWKLTAVFCMRYVGGFDGQILEALGSGNPDIRYEAVRAAGERGLDAAWRHVAAIVTSEEDDKPLLLAAIDAVAGIRPEEAPEILVDLVNSDDEDICGAVREALAMANALSDNEWEDDGKGAAA